MFLGIIFIIFQTLFVFNEAILKPLVQSENDYTHKTIINEKNPSQYVLFWKLIGNDEIQFEIHCKTNGWVGMGISSISGMEGADLVMGWIKDGVAVLKVKY